MKIAPEGLPFIVLPLVVTVVVIPFSVSVGLALIGTAGFMAFFFRDPERSTPASSENIYSPADGIVKEIAHSHEDKFLHAKVRTISIFLSLFDVHVNRSPITGEVLFTEYRDGHFFPAFLNKATAENESNYIGIKGDDITLLVQQIAGLIARRIVCNVKKKQQITQGEKIGLIQFGSCVKIYLPEHIKVCVMPGQRVKAGETIIAVTSKMT